MQTSSRNDRSVLLIGAAVLGLGLLVTAGVRLVETVRDVPETSAAALDAQLDAREPSSDAPRHGTAEASRAVHALAHAGRVISSVPSKRTVQHFPDNVTPMPEPYQWSARELELRRPLDEYFGGAVAPRARACMVELPEGRIRFHYRYALTGVAKWELVTDPDQALEVMDTTLSAEDEARAEACMREAIRGTAFIWKPDETSGNTYDVYWTWTTPAPAVASR